MSSEIPKHYNTGFPQFQSPSKTKKTNTPTPLNNLNPNSFLEKKQDKKESNTLDNKSLTQLETINNDLKIGSVKIDDNFNIETTVAFSQSDIILGMYTLPQIPSALSEIHLKFHGLCELICNKVLIKDLLGKGDENFLKEKISIKSLNKESILKSHLLDVYSVFNRMVAFLFNIYPDNIFSTRKQWNLVDQGKVNETILFKGLKKIDCGTTLKLEVFRKTGVSFSGHSLLLKKTNKNEFTLFDPNTGEHRGLSEKELAKKINEQISLFNGTDIFISKGDAYLKRLIDQKIIKEAKKKLPSS